MILEIIVAAAITVAVVAVAKHGSVSAALASAKREATNIEAIALKLEGDAKAQLSAIIARIRSL